MDSLITLPMLIAALAVLSAAAFFFLLATASIREARGRKLRGLGRSGSAGYRYARLILMRAERHLRSMHVAAFILVLGIGYLITRILSHPTMWSWLVAHVPGATSGLIVEYLLDVVLFVVVTVVALVCMQCGKAIVHSCPERVLMALALPIIYAQKLLGPIVFLIEGISRWVLSLGGIRPPLERERVISAEEINELVDLSAKAGEIEAVEQEIIESVLHFTDTLVREVMTPRSDVVSVSIDAPLQEVLQTFLTEGFSRLLVSGTNLDDVRGFILARDLLPLVGKAEPQFDVRSILRAAYHVPNTRKIDDLLKEMLRKKVQFAVVVDEHGGVDGIVTLEDLIEELVGEIGDETDSHEDVANSTELKSGDLIVDGSLAIDDLNSQYGYNFPVGAYDTVAGLLIDQLGRIPAQGEGLPLEGVRLTAEAVEQNRVISVRISSLPETPVIAITPSENSDSTADSAAPVRRISALR